MSKNVKPVNPMKVITGPETRWSYANVWEPKSINGGTSPCEATLTPVCESCGPNRYFSTTINCRHSENSS